MKQWILFIGFCLLILGTSEISITSAEPPKPSSIAKKTAFSPEPEFTEIYTTREILSDVDSRISKNFHIQKSMLWRTSFWFDIYTKFSSNMKVVHHKKYPWIIYDIIDTRLRKRGTVSRYVKKERWKTLKVLRSLAKRKNYRNLKGQERRFYRLLRQIPGKRKNVFRSALKNLRTQTGQREHFMAGLVRSSEFNSAMEAHFDEEGLPKELTRITLVESSFNTRAVSKVGASGVWQIMPRIGKKLMKVSSSVDERNSPLKATRAAARLLKSKMRILKEWPLAVTAYNTGPRELRRAAKKLKSTSLARMIRHHKSRHFGFASKNFYAEFLAALHAEKYQKEIFGTLVKKQPLRYDIYRLKSAKRIKARQLIKLSRSSRKELLTFNFDLRNALKKNSLLPKEILLYLPEGKGLILDRNLQKSNSTKKVSLSQVNIHAEQHSQYPHQL